MVVRAVIPVRESKGLVAPETTDQYNKRKALSPA
jgi:hypothetical protein